MNLKSSRILRVILFDVSPENSVVQLGGPAVPLQADGLNPVPDKQLHLHWHWAPFSKALNSCQNAPGVLETPSFTLHI